MGWFFDWGYLILVALLLIGGFVWAGIKTKSSGMIAWGVMFAVILSTVLVTEGISYWALPQHVTISCAFGVFLSAHPIAGFGLLTLWLLFCWALIAHLVTRKQVGDKP